MSLTRIYLGNLPFHVEPSALSEALTLACQPETASISITPFSHKRRKKKGCEDRLHPGFGYAEVQVEAEDEAERILPLLMKRLRDVVTLAGEEVSLKVELSHQPPFSSISEISASHSNTNSAGDEHEVLSKKRLAQRQHKKRQRIRSNSRRNGLLLSLIDQITEPGGKSTMGQ